MKIVKITGTCESCGHGCEIKIVNRIENVVEYAGDIEFRCCQCDSRIRDVEFEELDLKDTKHLQTHL